MSSFKYEVQDGAGRVRTGVVEAANVADATAQIRAQGGYLLNVMPVADSPAGLLDRIRGFRVEFGPGLKDVMNFTNQLAVMIKAGISIRGAIEGIAEQVDSPKFRRIILQLQEDVESGKPFSEALAKHPKVFSPLYVNMVRAAELSGSFGHMLERIANYLAQQVETRNMVRGAMVYPVIIGFMAVATTVFLLTFVLPRFTALFEGKADLLPKPTQILIALSGFLRTFWYAILAGLALLSWGFYYGTRGGPGRAWWDKCKLKIPLFRKMFRALYITRGLHTMGELVNAGVPMLETLAITAEISGNVWYKGMWQSVHSGVKQGDKIAEPLRRQSLLPRNVVQMVSAGEESGRLGEVMRDIAEYYSGELRNTIKSFTAMIEPLMIIIMGLVVGFIAMSIILPIFKMSSLVK